jgi:formylglycine-generating enzyme required for sulfatase activity
MDAVEYADWLDHAVRQNPSASPALSAILTARDCVVTLPGDAEWERGARGSGGRIYPWGDQPIDATRANYSGAIKPIGSYLNGRSEDGLFDMVGNVWEWTRTLMEPGPAPPLGFPYRPLDLAREHPRGSEYRVVRGGSFGNDLSQPTSASSTGYDPDGNKAIGFRLGISCNSQ